jgi:hypothetical protein
MLVSGGDPHVFIAPGETLTLLLAYLFRQAVRILFRNSRIAPGKSLVISVKLPWQSVTPFLGCRSSRRWKFSILRMIRPPPRIGDNGG